VDPGLRGAGGRGWCRAGLASGTGATAGRVDPPPADEAAGPGSAAEGQGEVTGFRAGTAWRTTGWRRGGTRWWDGPRPANGPDAHDADAHDADAHDADAHDADTHDTDTHDADTHDADTHDTDTHDTDAHDTDAHDADAHDADAHGCGC